MVRTVRLPTAYAHGAIPDTEHLLKSQGMKDWINNFDPQKNPLLEKFDGDSKHIIWAGDVWYSIKKHWVLELQRMVQAKRALARQTALK